MSIYEKILSDLLEESKKSDKNLDQIPPENIKKGLAIELIGLGVKYVISKVGKDASGNFLFKIKRAGGHEQVITHDDLINKYKRA